MDIESGRLLGRRDRLGCELLVKHKKRVFSVVFFILEANSFLLDLFGKTQLSIRIIAFLLSAVGSGMTLFTCVSERNGMETRGQAEKQLGKVELGFSVVQLIATFLAVLGTKMMNNIIASILLMLFAAIAVIYTFKKDEEGSDTSCLENISSVELLQIISHPNEIDEDLQIANTPNDIDEHLDVAVTPNEFDDSGILQAFLTRVMNIWILRVFLMRLMYNGILQAILIRSMSIWILQISLMRFISIWILQVFLMRLISIWIMQVFLFRLVSFWIMQALLIRLVNNCVLEVLLRSMNINLHISEHLSIGITLNETDEQLNDASSLNEIEEHLDIASTPNEIDEHLHISPGEIELMKVPNAVYNHVNSGRKFLPIHMKHAFTVLSFMLEALLFLFDGFGKSPWVVLLVSLSGSAMTITNVIAQRTTTASKSKTELELLENLNSVP